MESNKLVYTAGQEDVKSDEFDERTISTLEIAKQTNKEHRNVLADVRKLIAQEAIGLLTFQQSSYINDQNKVQPMYNLTFAAMMTLITGYNAVLRSRVIDRWMELEKQLPKVKLPTHLETARQLVSALEDNELLLKEAKENEPKVDYYEAVMDDTEAISMNDVAKRLNCGFGRNTLFEFLRNKKVLIPNSTQPYQHFINAGYFRIVQVRINNGKLKPKTVVYQKGMAYIQRLLNSERNLLVATN